MRELREGVDRGKGLAQPPCGTMSEVTFQGVTRGHLSAYNRHVTHCTAPVTFQRGSQGVTSRHATGQMSLYRRFLRQLTTAVSHPLPILSFGSHRRQSLHRSLSPALLASARDIFERYRIVHSQNPTVHQDIQNVIAFMHSQQQHKVAPLPLPSCPLN
jgi:hypothetical protein